MEATEVSELLDKLGPVIGVLSVVLGVLLSGWLQGRLSRKQARDSHESQLRLLQETHTQNLETLSLQQSQERDQRIRQYAESDRVDRLVVVEYVDLLLPR